jgi:hypothetical protein
MLLDIVREGTSERCTSQAPGQTRAAANDGHEHARFTAGKRLDTRFTAGKRLETRYSLTVGPVNNRDYSVCLEAAGAKDKSAKQARRRGRGGDYVQQWQARRRMNACETTETRAAKDDAHMTRCSDSLCECKNKSPAPPICSPAAGSIWPAGLRCQR